jgi:uncharacterized protein with GYD domain
MMFISLLSPKGKGKEALDYLRKLKPPKGIKIHGVYLTLGRYDAVVIFEVTDVNKAMTFAIETGFATDYTVETLTAIPIKDLRLLQLL